jgi:L,D-transpeptidase YcbB
MKNLHRAVKISAFIAISIVVGPPSARAIPVDQAGMQQAIARYRQIAESGGWPSIPQGPALKPDEEDARVPVLRTRLAATGDLDRRHDNGSTLFDASVQEALFAYQKRNGLEEDSILGPETRAALNVSAEQRLRELELSSERWRELMGRVSQGKAIVVNIPDFSLLALENGRPALSMRVIVGKDYEATPSFSELMEYIVLSPTWNVPQSIATKTILPKLQKDPGYLEKNNMQLLVNGKVIPAGSIQWGRVRPHNFPYRIVQKPGKNNALGRIKFIFPNKMAVYLHDTPQGHLFDRRERAFSHGCIRVEDPLALASFVLGGEWSQSRLQAAIDKGTEQRVNLPVKVPVHLVYQTAWVEPDGTVRFREDIYGRTQAALQSRGKKARPAGSEQARRGAAAAGQGG